MLTLAVGNQSTAVLLAAQAPATQTSLATGTDNGTDKKVSGATDELNAARLSKEDWTVLSLGGRVLEPHAAFVQQHDEHPGYTRDLVRVQWRTGDPIDLFVFLPAKVKHPPVILYLYSYPADTQRFFDEGWAERATADGYAAVGFASALTGSRFRMRPLKQWFVSELQESIGTSVHDVQMVLNYLASRNDVDMSRVGMYGQGSGGTIALLAAEADPRIKVLDVLSPWGDWPDWLKESKLIDDQERDSFLKPEFLQRAAAVEPIDALRHLKLAHLRIQQIGGDAATPPKAADAIAAAVPAGAIVQRFDDTHAHQRAMRATGAFGWLKEQLPVSQVASPARPSDGDKPVAVQNMSF